MGLHDDQYEAEQPDYRNMVVWGFYEDNIPTYEQGIGGEHELTSPVTATEINTLLWDLIEAIRVLKAVSDWVNDLGYYSDAGTELAPVFQKVNGFLETEIAKRLLAGLDETAK